MCSYFSSDAIIPSGCGRHRISASWFTKVLFTTLLRPVVTQLGQQIALLFGIWIYLGNRTLFVLKLIIIIIIIIIINT